MYVGAPTSPMKNTVTVGDDNKSCSHRFFANETIAVGQFLLQVLLNGGMMIGSIGR